ncbi:FGFR3/4b-like protein [Leptotrombidium deliense]|uniref:FGFR3/4b-like protein n=1 Tax=Leptotrombidium deliense TaxID=299467 RepID=A0A443S064_9ACAR|nr:FGFR3/4b-like protein [Leptotrombidium deliense]
MRLTKDTHSLHKEIEVMRSVRKHQNIINLIGYYVKDDAVSLVIEYAENGSLESLLTQLVNYPNQITIHGFIDFSNQVVYGMQHLTACGIVHRDLATRNVLITKNNVLKISDFGLSRKLDGEGFYKVTDDNEVFPVRWTAPEAWKERTFSTKTDVWSFGVLLWELFTFAANPYNTIKVMRILMSRVENGLRLSRPEICPQNVYTLVQCCCSGNANSRPDFPEIINCYFNN